MEEMKETGLKIGRDMKDNFARLLKEKMDKNIHRMKSLYSYNIFDHPDFMQSQKIEKRIKKYYQKKAAKDAHSQGIQSTLKPEEIDEEN